MPHRHAQPLTFLYGTFVPDCTHRIDKHFEGYYTLQYMAGAAVDLTVGANRHALEGRWFWSCYPGPRIRFHVAPGHASWPHRYLAFRGPLVARWTAEGLFPIAPQRAPGGAGYADRFDALLELAGRTDRWGTRRAIHALEAILLDLAEARAEHAAPPEDHAVGPEPGWLPAVLAKLEAAIRAEAAPDYGHWAGELGISVRTFRRRFAAAVGVTPHVYLLQQRVGQARKLLAETDVPVKEVARRLGYKDVFFFTRQFRALTGAPPAAYRKSTQG